jgi:hypothetical protein
LAIYDLWTGLADFQERPGGGDFQCVDWAQWKVDRTRWRSRNKSTGRIRVYDADTHKQVAQLDDHLGAVNDLAFSATVNS